MKLINSVLHFGFVFTRSFINVGRIHRMYNAGYSVEEISAKLGTDPDWTRSVAFGFTKY